jgi:hypothetical protein
MSSTTCGVSIVYRQGLTGLARNQIFSAGVAVQ